MPGQTTLAVSEYEEGVGCDARCSTCRLRCSGNKTRSGHVHYCANHYWDSLPQEVRERDLAVMAAARELSRKGGP